MLRWAVVCTTKNQNYFTTKSLDPNLLFPRGVGIIVEPYIYIYICTGTQQIKLNVLKMEKNIVILRESDRGESGGRSGQIWGAGGGQLATHGSMLGSADGPIRKGVAIGLDGKCAAAKPTVHVDTGLLGPFIWPRAYWANWRSHLYINVYIYIYILYIYSHIFLVLPYNARIPFARKGYKDIYIYNVIYIYIYIYIPICSCIFLYGHSFISARAYSVH